MGEVPRASGEGQGQRQEDQVYSKQLGGARYLFYFFLVLPLALPWAFWNSAQLSKLLTTGLKGRPMERSFPPRIERRYWITKQRHE